MFNNKRFSLKSLIFTIGPREGYSDLAKMVIRIAGNVGGLRDMPECLD